MTQTLIALLALLGSAVVDLRGFYGSGIAEIGLVSPAQSHEAHEKFASITRALEETEEYFSNDAPYGRSGRGWSASADAGLRAPAAAAWRPPTRCLCAHPPTGPPSA